MMRVDDARVSKFETALSKLVVSDQNFKRRQVPKNYAAVDKTTFVVLHPQQSALKLFSASSTCGAKPGKLGVVRNVMRSKEEHEALIRCKDKDKVSSMQGDDGGTSSTGKSASNREDPLVQLLQEVRDALKQSNTVNSSLSPTANSAVSSVISPNESVNNVGSTIIAQASLSSDAAQDDNLKVPERDYLNFKMPGSGNVVAHLSVRSNIMRTQDGGSIQFHHNLFN
jgi:hypothetical protein